MGRGCPSPCCPSYPRDTGPGCHLLAPWPGPAASQIKPQPRASLRRRGACTQSSEAGPALPHHHLWELRYQLKGEQSEANTEKHLSTPSIKGFGLLQGETRAGVINNHQHFPCQLCAARGFLAHCSGAGSPACWRLLEALPDAGCSFQFFTENPHLQAGATLEGESLFYPRFTVPEHPAFSFLSKFLILGTS